jgi:hypothetical protein
MLLLAYLLNVLERTMAEQCILCKPIRLFAGLGICDPGPDHSTVTLFKRRLYRESGTSDLEAVANGITRPALETGMRSWSTQIVDSLYKGANVSNRDGQVSAGEGAALGRPGCHRNEQGVVPASLPEAGPSVGVLRPSHGSLGCRRPKGASEAARPGGRRPVQTLNWP